MKKNSKKSRQLQREKENRLEQEYAKAKASPDSRRGRRIHTCYHYSLGTEPYDCEWECSTDLSPRPWNKPDMGKQDGSWGILLTTIPVRHLKSAKFRGYMTSYVYSIFDTECKCSQCHKIFPIKTLEILKEMKELQIQRYKYRDRKNGLWANYEDKEIRGKIQELGKLIPPVRYRKLSPDDFIYVDE